MKTKKFVLGLAAAMMLTAGTSTIFPPVDAQAAAVKNSYHLPAESYHNFSGRCWSLRSGGIGQKKKASSL